MVVISWLYSPSNNLVCLVTVNYEPARTAIYDQHTLTLKVIEMQDKNTSKVVHSCRTSNFIMVSKSLEINEPKAIQVGDKSSLRIFKTWLIWFYDAPDDILRGKKLQTVVLYAWKMFLPFFSYLQNFIYNLFMLRSPEHKSQLKSMRKFSVPSCRQLYNVTTLRFLLGKFLFLS